MYRVAIAMVVVALTATAAAAKPIVVRTLETAMRATPVVRSESGETVAVGELSQVARGDDVESRLLLRFIDGSIHEERARFSQRGVLTLLHYDFVQRGPSFPQPIEASLDRGSERFDVRYQRATSGPWRSVSGRFAVPADVYSGMLPVVLRQLDLAAVHEIQIVAFTPVPRLFKVRLEPAGEDRLVVGGRSVTALRYEMRPVLGALAGFFMGDLVRATSWVTGSGDAPQLVKFQGPLYYPGPVWRIEQP